MTQQTLTELSEAFAAPHWPQFLKLENQPDDIQIELGIDASIHWFEGHFPEQPVLAGVVQTHWAGELGKHFFPLGNAFCRVDNLKFQNVILPDRNITLHLRYNADKNAVKFQYKDNDRNYSEGTLVFQKDA